MHDRTASLAERAARLLMLATATVVVIALIPMLLLAVVVLFPIHALVRLFAQPADRQPHEGGEQ